MSDGSSASASATRAQLAGYEAPAVKEDDILFFQLPPEMLSYGQRPQVDFVSAEDRLPLGFPVYVEQDNTLIEELGGVIERLGGDGADHGEVSHR